MVVAGSSGMRLTNRVATRSGGAFMVAAEAPATTLEYPSLRGANASLVQTAQLVLVDSQACDLILDQFPMEPFTEAEIASISDGRLSSSFIALAGC